MNIIDERDKQNIYRKLMKKKYDEMMDLSTSDGQWVRLLDEGMVTYADGSPMMYLMKGTLRRFVENLSDDYVGSINIGHTDLASFPERIVGEWTKSDLRLESIGDGREALYVNLRLNEDHPLVKALRMAKFDLGVSAEFFRHVNEELTERTDLNPWGVPIVDGIDMRDFAIVGDAGNVNSMGIHLKGGNALKKNKLEELLAKEGGSSIAEITKLLDDALPEASEEEVSEETETEEEETTEETEETSEDASEETEETSEEEVSEETTEEATPEPEENLASVLSALMKEVADLRTENSSLKEQLSVKEKEEAEFVRKFKKLSVSLATTPKQPEPEEHKVYTDGIGE